MPPKRILSTHLTIRLTRPLRRLLDRAAANQSLPLSLWARRILERIAREELGE